MSDVTVLGMEEILKKLKKLPERVQKNVLTGAIRASAKPIVKEAKRLVPTDSGTLKKSIGVRKRRSKNKNIIRFSIAPLSKKDGYYGRFIEFGTYAKLDHPMKRPRMGKLGERRAKIVANGGGIPAHPFMRPAFEKEGENTIKAAKEYMNKRIDKEIAKL